MMRIGTPETREVEIHLADGTSKMIESVIIGQYAVHQSTTEGGQVGWSVSHILSGYSVSNNKAVISIAGDDDEAKRAAIDLARKLSWIDADWYVRDGCRDASIKQQFLTIYQAWKAEWR